MVATGLHLSIASSVVRRSYRSRLQLLYFAGQLECQPTVRSRRSCLKRIIVHHCRQGNAGKRRLADDLPIQP